MQFKFVKFVSSICAELFSFTNCFSVDAEKSKNHQAKKNKCYFKFKEHLYPTTVYKSDFG